MSTNFYGIQYVMGMPVRTHLGKRTSLGAEVFGDPPPHPMLFTWALPLVDGNQEDQLDLDEVEDEYGRVMGVDDFRAHVIRPCTEHGWSTASAGTEWS